MNKLVSVLCFVVVLASRPVSAGIVTFDFSGLGGDQGQSFTVTEYGYDLQISALVGPANACSGNEHVRANQSGKGLGVHCVGQVARVDDTNDATEALLLKLLGISRAFLVEATFTSAKNQIVDIYADEMLASSAAGNTQIFTPGLYGTSFGFTPGGEGHDFRLLSVTFDIPEPSMLALFGLGLLGAGMSRIRRRR